MGGGAAVVAEQRHTQQQQPQQECWPSNPTCRMVHGRRVYIDAYGPRVKGNTPGSSPACPSRFSAVYTGSTLMPWPSGGMNTMHAQGNGVSSSTTASDSHSGAR